MWDIFLNASMKRMCKKESEFHNWDSQDLIKTLFIYLLKKLVEETIK